MFTGRGRSRPRERGGIAPDAGRPSKFLLPPRGVRWLAAYIRSTLDRTCRPKAATATAQLYIREARPLRSIAAEKETLHFAPDLLLRRLQRFAAGIDDNRPLGVQPFQLKPNGFADAPPDPVARHGFTQRPGCGESNMRSAGFRLAKAERGEERTGKA
jgi:hypothetical protein